MDLVLSHIDYSISVGYLQGMKTPIAILISDVHYSLNTWQIADLAFRQAIKLAAKLKVPLLDCGDLSNDKALLRAEYVNALLRTVRYAREQNVSVYCLIGNHSLLNEKGDDHALHFLATHVNLISTPQTLDGFNFIPYQTNPDKFYEAINQFPKGAIVIGHQGTIGGQLGDYIKDSSAINPEKVADWKVFLGHYHSHYELGTTVSIGNPYTLTWGEANDPPKGFLILYSDGTFERILTHLRAHKILTYAAEELTALLAGKGEPVANANDLVWVKVSGPRSSLDKLDKKVIGRRIVGSSNFKLDKLYSDQAPLEASTEKMPPDQVFDALIDAQGNSPLHTESLKKLWRSVML